MIEIQILRWVFVFCLNFQVYPRVKVKQVEDDDQYAYEKNSLQSVKAFEWLSLNDSSSSDDSPPSVVRIPDSNVPKSPISAFTGSKGKASNKMKTVLEENQKNVRASSVPRPRAVLSSPDNDGIIGSKTKTRRVLNSTTKDHCMSQNRHTQHKVFPRSTANESFGSTLIKKKEVPESKHDLTAKGREEVLKRKQDLPAKGRTVPSLRSVQRKPQYPVTKKPIN